MLSIGKLAAGAGGYYTQMVAQGAEEYFAGAREAPGVWIGRSSDNLGLSGTVLSSDFADVLAHRRPGTDERLTAARSAPTVVGFDATFCAPKSVSVLHGLGPPELATTLRDAHDAAVIAAMAVLDAQASRGRRGRGGMTVVDGDGFVAAGFRHRTSRNGDPHLHTHVVIANLVRGPDDRWTALDARPLYQWAKTVGYLYEAQLRHELSGRLHADWTPVKRGIADLSVVPRAVIEEFSTRRREIEAHLAESGFSSARAAQLATYATRRMKDHRATVETLVEGWHKRAEGLGFDPAVASDQLHDQQESPVRHGVDIEALFVELAGPDGLTKNRSTFHRRDVIQGICDRLPDGAPVDTIIEWSEQFLESDHAVQLFDTDPGVIHTRRGAVSARTDELRYSTPDMIATEHRLTASALKRARARVGVVPVDAVGSVINARPSLTDEQEMMVWRLCTHGRGVDVVEGVAGAGKTYALAAANQAWTEAGFRVMGCSLAAKAARGLQAEAGIESMTIDRMLLDLDRPDAAGFAAGSVVVVDEAAMVGTRKLVRLLDHAAATNAKVVLVGDPCQLPEIEAGGAFVGLASRLTAAPLVDNRRQREEWERVVLGELRAGHTDTALGVYLDQGRVILAATGTDVREQMIDDWDVARERETTVMLAARVDDVHQLNAAARDRLQATGTLGPDEVQISGHGFSKGDLVLALRNDRRVGVLNGTRAVVERIDTDEHQILCRTEDHERVVIPFDYAEAGHLTHAYAMTIHKAQGATFDRCLVFAGDQLTKESAYTAMSRGRNSNDLYVIGDTRRDDAHMAEHDEQPLDQLRSNIRRRSAQTMAIDHEQPPGPEIDDDLGAGL